MKNWEKWRKYHQIQTRFVNTLREYHIFIYCSTHSPIKTRVTICTVPVFTVGWAVVSSSLSPPRFTGFLNPVICYFSVQNCVLLLRWKNWDQCVSNNWLLSPRFVGDSARTSHVTTSCHRHDVNFSSAGAKLHCVFDNRNRHNLLCYRMVK